MTAKETSLVFFKDNPQDKKTKVSLIIFSSLFLLTWIIIILLNPKLDKKSSLSLKEKMARTSVSKIPQQSQTEYENRDFGFRISYPQEWGEVTTETVANRQIFWLGDNTRFSLVIGSFLDASSQPLLPEDLARDMIKSGCRQWSIDRQRQSILRVACPKLKDSSEQAYLRQEETIYILNYRYDSGKTSPDEAEAVFESVLDRFELI
ncbi:MAG: hypothetical protein JW991_02215 [Candidatus Pacebacteria bacterium]|nr:hypothetical protein [Candidatus Paceibacterota bacterium]